MALTLTGPVAIAHRGSRQLWPENTMAAFQGAVDLGYRWLETDVHRSSDGVVMCIHDPTVDRTTDRRGRVAAFSAVELELMDAGRALAGGTAHPGVPRLEEVLTSFADVALVIDLKEDGLEEPLFELLVRLRATERVVVGSFSDRRLRRFRVVSSGGVLTSAGRSAVLRTRLTSARPAKRVADALQIPEHFGRMRIVSPALIERARQAGMATHVWTVNDSADMHRLIDWGVDGIITDRPDLLRSVLEARGLWR